MGIVDNKNLFSAKRKKFLYLPKKPTFGITFNAILNHSKYFIVGFRNERFQQESLSTIHLYI